MHRRYGQKNSGQIAERAVPPSVGFGGPALSL